MDIWGALALVFAGAFFATLIVALFYWVVVRPRLLALTSSRAAPPPTDLASPNEPIQANVQALSEALVRHSALVAKLPTSFEIHGPEAVSTPTESIEAWGEIRALVMELSAVKNSTTIQLAEHQDMLDDLQLALMEAQAALTEISAQLTAHGDRLSIQQEDTLNELRLLLENFDVARSQASAQITAHSDRISLLQEDALDKLLTRVDDLGAMQTQSSAQTTAHSDRLFAQQEDALRELRTRFDDLGLAQQQVSTTDDDHTDIVQGLDALRKRLDKLIQEFEDDLTGLREQISMTLQGQQTQTGLLDVLASREPPSAKTVIREERLVVQDRLTDINGIGPTYAGRLHEQGIHSFRQLEQLTSDELSNIVDKQIGAENWAEEWLEQAALFASQQDKTEDAL